MKMMVVDLSEKLYCCYQN